MKIILLNGIPYIVCKSAVSSCEIQKITARIVHDLDVEMENDLRKNGDDDGTDKI